MKSSTPSSIASKILAASTLVFAVSAPALAAPSIVFSSSRVWLEGRSTLHPYKATSHSVDISVGLASSISPASFAAGLRKGGLSTLVVKIPTKSLKSPEGGMMNSALYKNLKADANPDISFDLASYHVVSEQGSRLDIEATGALTVAGHEQDVTLDAEGQMDGSKIHITGKKALKMSDFGIQPPVMMFGAIKTSDKVVIHYDLEGEIR